MPLTIVRDDIVHQDVDALVTAANPRLAGGGGVDGAIHRAAGPALAAACAKIGYCPTGSACITEAGRLPCKFVIHAVGPVWHGGTRNERALLAACYAKALELAVANGCRSVAFPLISSGTFGYPKGQALGVAVETIGAFLETHDLAVTLVIFDSDSYAAGQQRFADIAAFIDDRYVGRHLDRFAERRRRQALADSDFLADRDPPCPRRTKPAGRHTEPGEAWKDSDTRFSFATSFTSHLPTLDAFIADCGETFSEAVLRLIRERHLTQVECYRRANLDRRLFSKIRSGRNYHPNKRTACALAIALRLNLEETQDLLATAGFALGRSDKFDLILTYFITNGQYNVFAINEALFAFDQPLLGA